MENSVAYGDVPPCAPLNRTGRYPAIAKALAPLPEETVVDGGWLLWINGEQTVMCSHADKTQLAVVFPVSELHINGSSR